MKKNSCVYGKAYHFWMAAKTVQKLKNEDKISAKRATTAAYTSGAFTSKTGSIALYESLLEKID